MTKITKIEVQKNNKERFNLFLDEVFEMGIDIDTLVRFNLKKGQILEPSDMENIQKYEHYRLGINMAIQYLSYKKRTEKEVRQHLQQNEISDIAIQQVIDYCYRESYINHEDYAESLKNTMINTTDKGPEIFRQKLYQVGIEPNIINTYVPIYEEEQSFEAVIEVAKKIMKTKKGPEIKIRQKVLQSLIQKGYSMDVVQQAIAELNFEQDENILDDLLQKDLEKVYTKQRRKYDGQQSVMKTIESLMRKGYKYDKIKSKLEESGISDE
ncbi:recombination regulator RecX [Staphylococcus haemolyticus]|uniref:recombination regulator RecX n=1 Tax=Staphylococcus haemolyticus TaxID=1283 RepID=UPI0028FE07DB|nr:recombination regulator RecX [Staphylococcus haemolyticus]MDU0423016.1 recombination regulator RecX [Staphylococcus haemolyticus]MDU0439645.1 recombination regulator RecX [Staphylococcus haemolyticus]MDU0442426.1 recombination regulator RecX [Staphylococcus haemolyticus]MDU0444582.1 recombination regulator RecX [Staphylococcus haemolyticus]MDU0449156.1 recombination regulator RecX [Staphylococcus haemolyticus]